MKISKEVLSEVLGINNISSIIYDIDFPNIIEYNQYATLARGMRSTEINIYELAIKCKDWILSKGYYFNIYSFNFSGNTEQEHRVRLLIGNDVVYWGNDSCEETEVEAIILASEWVLKEINEKQLQH